MGCGAASRSRPRRRNGWPFRLGWVRGDVHACEARQRPRCIIQLAFQHPWPPRVEKAGVDTVLASHVRGAGARLQTFEDDLAFVLGVLTLGSANPMSSMRVMVHSIRTSFNVGVPQRSDLLGRSRKRARSLSEARPLSAQMTEARQALSWSPIGRLRMRLPVAAKIALHSAGAKGGTPGSPTPADGTSILLFTIWTFVTFGLSSMRTTR